MYSRTSINGHLRTATTSEERPYLANTEWLNLPFKNLRGTATSEDQPLFNGPDRGRSSEVRLVSVFEYLFFYDFYDLKK